MGGALTTTYDRIIRQPALTMPGNFTGSEAACTAGNASSIRTLLSLATTSEPTFAGLILNSHLKFSPTNQYDVGDGTYDPRTVRAATSVLTPLVNNASAALTLGNSTYGVTVPGALTVGGTTTADVIVNRDTGGGSATWGLGIKYQSSLKAGIDANVGTGEVRIGGLASSYFPVIYSNGTAALTFSTAGAATFSGDISMQKAAQGYIRAYGTGGVNNIAMYDDNTNGIVSTSSGALVLSPSNGDVNIYGNHLDNASLNIPANGNGLGWNVTKSATEYIDCPYGGVISGLRHYGSVPFTISTAAVPILLNSGTNIYNFGASTSSRPAIKASSTTAAFRLGDDSADAPISCAGITASGVISSSAGYTFPVNTYLNSSEGNARIYFASSGPSIWAAGTNSGVLHQFRALSGSTLLEVSSTGTVVTSDISMSKTSAQGYIRAYSPNGLYNAAMYHDNTDATFSAGTGDLRLRALGGVVRLQASSGFVVVGESGVQNIVRIYDSTLLKQIQLTHDGTNGIVSTSSGDLRHSAATGAVVCYTPSVASVMYVYAGNGSSCATVQHNGTLGIMAVSHGIMRLQTDQATNGFEFRPKSGYIEHYTPGANANYTIWDSTGSKYLGATHDGTNGILSTSSGNLNLVPTGGTVAVTGGITASGAISHTGQQHGVVAKSANYTMTADDYLVEVTANSIDITFETAVGCAGRVHEVFNSGAGTVTLKTTSAQTISGNASGSLTLAQYKSITVKSNGANWMIMSQIT
jgi:hypothetical protein